MRWFHELKRRNVFKVAGAYAVVAFVLLQVADLLVPALLLPDWTFRLLAFFTLMGFPVALVLAWAFELTPEGVKRTEPLPGDVDTPRSASSARPRVLPLAGTAGVVLIGVAGAGWWVGRDAGPGSADAATAESGGTAMAAVASEDRSIAVLPFTNVSGDPENEYFSDGMTEDILTNLALMRDLRVISRTSVMQYKGTTKSLPEIGRELGVRYVLEGSVRRVGDRVRITGQLIEAETDTHLWASNYDRDVTDVFAIQTEIARAIADALQATLSETESARLAGGPPTVNIDAYDAYLKARHAASLGRRATVREAARLYEQAVTLDPDFALAHAALARYLNAVARMDGDTTLRHRARASARRALELAPDRPESYLAMASITDDEEQAHAYMQRALELNPNHAEVLYGMSGRDFVEGRLAEALRKRRRVVELEPTNVLYTNILAWTYRTLGLYAEALRWQERAELLSPGFPYSAVERANIALDQGRFDEARTAGMSIYEIMDGEDPPGSTVIAVADMGLGRYREALERIERHVQRGPERAFEWAVELAFLHRAVGNEAEARRFLARGLDHHAGEPVSGYSRRDLARLTLLAGDADAAMGHLRSAFDLGYRDVGSVRHDPVLAPLRDRADFQQLLSAMDSAVARERQLLLADGG